MTPNPDTGEEPVWINGKENYPLYSMDTKHIQNALNKYQRNGYGMWSWQATYRSFWVKEFTEELQVRELDNRRDPSNGMWVNNAELMKQRKAHRLLLGLPPMKPFADIPVRAPKPKVSLFTK